MSARLTGFVITAALTLLCIRESGCRPAEGPEKAPASQSNTPPAPAAPTAPAAVDASSVPASQEPIMPDTPSTSAASRDDRPQKNRFTGTLRGGILAAGSETTGWQLETEPGKRVDVDVSKAGDDVGALDGKAVVVEGTMTTRRWIERGPRPFLIAERIEAAK